MNPIEQTTENKPFEPVISSTPPTSPEVPITLKYKKLIGIVTIFSIIISIYAIYVYFSRALECHEGIGCIVLIPFYIPILPLYPAFSYISSITTLQHVIIGSPSIFKFYAFFVVFFNMFLVSGIIVSMSLYVSNISTTTVSNELGNFKRDFTYIMKKVGFYLFVAFILFSLFNVAANPPPSLTSDQKIISFCEENSYMFDTLNQCLPSYLSSTIPNCSGEKSIFLYPYIANINKPDSCTFTNFISEKPFEGMVLSQNEYFKDSNRDFCLHQLGLTSPKKDYEGQIGILMPGDNKGFITEENAMNRIFIYFADILVDKSTHEQRNAFCATFSANNTQNQNSKDDNRDPLMIINPKLSTVNFYMQSDMEYYQDYEKLPGFPVDYIVNPPDQLIEWTATTSEEWIKIPGSGSSVNGGGIIHFSLKPLGFNLPAGIHRGTVTLSGNFPPQTITVILTVTD